MTNLSEAFVSKNDPVSAIRLRAISPITSMPHNTPEEKRERNRMIERVAADMSVSPRTILRWVQAYAESGMKGLEPQYPKVRSDVRLYVKFESLLNEAKMMRMQTPTISVRSIIRCLESRHENIKGIIKRSTLQRHLADAGFDRRTLLSERERDGRGFFGRYRLPHRMLQIQGDVKEPPRGVCVDENDLPVTPYVQLWMDNYSRKVLSWKVSPRQTEELALSSLRTLIESYGIPDTILTDQGSIYRGSAINHCTYYLGIVHKRSRPYRPEAKGALERLNGTLDDLFIPIKELEHVKFSKFTELVEQRIMEYNRAKHSALVIHEEDGKAVTLSPDEAFARDQRTVKAAPPELMDLAFNETVFRIVSKDGLISFQGKHYRLTNDVAKPKERVMLKHSLTDDKVHLLIRNSDENIRNGEAEFLERPLQKFEIEPRVRFEEVMKKAMTQEKQQLKNNLPQFPAQVECLVREICKKNGTYTDEAHFLEHQLPELIQKLSIKTDLPQSAYSQQMSGTAPTPGQMAPAAPAQGTAQASAPSQMQTPAPEPVQEMAQVPAPAQESVPAQSGVPAPAQELTPVQGQAPSPATHRTPGGDAAQALDEQTAAMARVQALAQALAQQAPAPSGQLSGAISGSLYSQNMEG